MRRGALPSIVKPPLFLSPDNTKTLHKFQHCSSTGRSISWKRWSSSVVFRTSASPAPAISSILVVIIIVIVIWVGVSPSISWRRWWFIVSSSINFLSLILSRSWGGLFVRVDTIRWYLRVLLASVRRARVTVTTIRWWNGIMRFFSTIDSCS